MTGPIDAVMVDAGNRGYFVYGAYALRHPNEVRFVAVAEPDEGCRRRFVEGVRHGATETLTSGWESLESHLMAFAAEQSRTTGEVVQMAEYRATFDAARR